MTNLTDLLQEQKKELREKLNKSYLRLAYGKSGIEKTKQEVDEVITTAITKGYELALEEVGKKIEQHHKEELAELSTSDNKDSTKEYIRKGLEVYKTQLLTNLALLKETSNKEIV